MKNGKSDGITDKADSRIPSITDSRTVLALKINMTATATKIIIGEFRLNLRFFTDEYFVSVILMLLWHTFNYIKL